MSVSDYRALLSSGATVKVKRRNTPEEDLHRAAFTWIGLMTPRHRILRFFFHTPNGGKRPKGEAGKLRAMGQKPGVPDLLLPRRRGIYTGLAVELKSATGRLSDDQREWLSALEEEGYLTAVCRDLDAVQAVVSKYLGGKA